MRQVRETGEPIAQVAVRISAVMHGRSGLVPAEWCVRRPGYSVRSRLGARLQW